MKTWLGQCLAGDLFFEVLLKGVQCAEDAVMAFKAFRSNGFVSGDFYVPLDTVKTIIWIHWNAFCSRCLEQIFHNLGKVIIQDTGHRKALAFLHLTRPVWLVASCPTTVDDSWTPADLASKCCLKSWKPWKRLVAPRPGRKQLCQFGGAAVDPFFAETSSTIVFLLNGYIIMSSGQTIYYYLRSNSQWLVLVLIPCSACFHEKAYQYENPIRYYQIKNEVTLSYGREYNDPSSLSTIKIIQHNFVIIIIIITIIIIIIIIIIININNNNNIIIMVIVCCLLFILIPPTFFLGFQRGNPCGAPAAFIARTPSPSSSTAACAAGATSLRRWPWEHRRGPSYEAKKGSGWRTKKAKQKQSEAGTNTSTSNTKKECRHFYQ